MVYNEELSEHEIAKREDMDRAAREYKLMSEKTKVAVYWHKSMNSGVWFPSNKWILQSHLNLLKPQDEVYDIIVMNIKDAHVVKGTGLGIPKNLEMSKEKIKELGI